MGNDCSQHSMVGCLSIYMQIKDAIFATPSQQAGPSPQVPALLGTSSHMSTSKSSHCSSPSEKSPLLQAGGP